MVSLFVFVRYRARRHQRERLRAFQLMREGGVRVERGRREGGGRREERGTIVGGGSGRGQGSAGGGSGGPKVGRDESNKAPRGVRERLRERSENGFARLRYRRIPLVCPNRARALNNV